MGRIAKGVCGLLLALGLFACPVTARASDGFLGGLEDLTGTRQVEPEQRGYEESFTESYEPELRELESTPVRALPEDATTVDYVNDTVESFNHVPVGNTRLTWFQTVQMVLGNSSNASSHSGQMRQMYLLPAIGIVFMWWGIRKSKNMIMAAFRKGKASI